MKKMYLAMILALSSTSACGFNEPINVLFVGLAGASIGSGATYTVMTQQKVNDIENETRQTKNEIRQKHNEIQEINKKIKEKEEIRIKEMEEKIKKLEEQNSGAKQN